ncbi:hypothetical protein EV174_006529, partial [Coemansia sp. RSA 2320]
DSMIPRTTFRSPAPASQPEYKRSVTAASDLFNNPYYKRDVRRNYPRTDVYTQPDVRDVVEALAKLQSPVYSPSNMPPVPGTAYKYKLSPEQHAEGPGEYYPSYRVY